MPEFTWSGRDQNGAPSTGSLWAADQMEAIMEVRRRGIIAHDVSEARYDRPRGGMRTFGFAFYAFACVAGAVLLASLMPVNIIRCSADRSCTVEHRLAGVYSTGTESIENVTAVESLTGDMSDRSFLSSSTPMIKTYLILKGTGSIDTDPMTTGFPTHEHIRRNLESFLADPNRKQFVARQGEVAMLVPPLLLWAALHFVRLAFRG